MADFKRIRANIENLIESDADDKEIDDYLESEGVTLKQVQRNMPMYKDVINSTVSGAVDGLTSIPRLATTMYNMSVGKNDSMAAKGIEALTPNIAKYDPATRSGQYAKAGAGGVTSSLLPGGMIGKPLSVGLTGLTGGMAGEFAAGAFPENEGLARFAGNVLGGSTVSVPKLSFLNRSSARQVKDATSGMNELDWSNAQDMQSLGKTFGIDLTPADVLGKKAPAIAAKQLQVEQSPRSSAIMQELLQKRPGQVTTAIEGLTAKVGSKHQDPSALGRLVSGEASRKIRGEELFRTEQTNPIYKAAGNDVLPQDNVNRLLFQINAAKLNDKTGAFSPQLNYLEKLLTDSPAIPAQKATRTAIQKPGMEKPIYQHKDGKPGQPAQAIADVDNLSRARRVMRGRVELPPFAADAVDKETAKVVGNITDDLNALLQRHSPAYAAANQRYMELTPQVVAKQKGMLGDISGMSSPAQQFERLINQELSTPRTIADTAGDFRRAQKFPPAEIGAGQAYPDLVRYGLDNSLDSASRKLAGGAEDFIGARYARNMRLTPQRSANVMAALESLPNGKSVAQGFSNLLDVLEATGNRIPVGSRTAFNARAYDDMTSGVLKDVIKHPTSLGLRPLMDAWDNMNTKRWARLFTDPNSVQKLRKLSMMNPKSEAAADFATMILSSVKTPEEEEQ